MLVRVCEVIVLTEASKGILFKNNLNNVQGLQLEDRTPNTLNIVSNKIYSTLPIENISTELFEIPAQNVDQLLHDRIDKSSDNVTRSQVSKEELPIDYDQSVSFAIPKVLKLINSNNQHDENHETNALMNLEKPDIQDFMTGLLYGYDLPKKTDSPVMESSNEFHSSSDAHEIPNIPENEVSVYPELKVSSYQNNDPLGIVDDTKSVKVTEPTFLPQDSINHDNSYNNNIQRNNDKVIVEELDNTDFASQQEIDSEVPFTEQQVIIESRKMYSPSTNVKYNAFERPFDKNVQPNLDSYKYIPSNLMYDQKLSQENDDFYKEPEDDRVPLNRLVTDEELASAAANVRKSWMLVDSSQLPTILISNENNGISIPTKIAMIASTIAEIVHDIPAVAKIQLVSNKGQQGVIPNSLIGRQIAQELWKPMNAIGGYGFSKSSYRPIYQNYLRPRQLYDATGESLKRKVWEEFVQESRKGLDVNEQNKLIQRLQKVKSVSKRHLREVENGFPSTDSNGFLELDELHKKITRASKPSTRRLEPVYLNTIPEKVQFAAELTKVQIKKGDFTPALMEAARLFLATLEHSSQGLLMETLNRITTDDDSNYLKFKYSHILDPDLEIGLLLLTRLQHVI